MPKTKILSKDKVNIILYVYKQSHIHTHICERESKKPIDKVTLFCVCSRLLIEKVCHAVFVSRLKRMLVLG